MSRSRHLTARPGSSLAPPTSPPRRLTWFEANRRAEVPRLRQVALDTAAAGMFVFPVDPMGKIPIFHSERRCRGYGVCSDGHQKWEQRATRDPRLIRRWWHTAPNNVAIACGPSGLIVLDLDIVVDNATGVTVVDGRAALARIESEHGVALPDTRTVTTPSGGEHRYFRQPPGRELRNTQGVLGPGIDTRGAGGAITAPGSVTRRGIYLLSRDVAIAELPTWLIPTITPPPPPEPGVPRTKVVHAPRPYLDTVLASTIAAVADARKPDREYTIRMSAAGLAHYIGPGQLTFDEVHSCVRDAAAGHVGVQGMTGAEIERAVLRGIAYGMRTPIILAATEPPGVHIPRPR